MKRYFILVSLVFVFMALAACNTDTGNVNSDNPIDELSKSVQEEKTTSAGIYNGQADSDTIEIETDEGPTAFQLTMEARSDVDKFTEGNEVTYTYYENGEQLVIKAIKSNTSEGKVTGIGTYNGQTNQDTIEIETDEGPIDFELTLEASNHVTKLKEGCEVIYKYYENDEQVVIESISENV